MLIDIEIDMLNGRNLDSAVARAKGWAGDEMFPHYSIDNGEAVGLLLGKICDIEIECGRVKFTSYRMEGRRAVISGTAGPVGEFATLASRAFLKCRNREQQ